jgi:hypothetical protein
MDVMQRNPERELAFTTRTVEYMWCGLPVIHHDYDELSDLIREYEAGWTVDPADRAALDRVVAEILAKPAEAARRGRNAQRLVRERLTWDRTAESLDYFVRHPRLRQNADRQPAPIPAGSAGTFSLGTLRYLLRAAWGVYRQYGLGTVWHYGVAFLRRQIAARTRGAA